MRKNNNQNGFTLIEVLIAIALLTIGILGAAAMQIASLEGNSNAIRITQASTWAENRLEILMARPYAHADLADLSNTGVNAGVTGLNNTNVAGSLADGGPVVSDGFTIYWNVAENTPLTDTKTIRVLVVRTDKGRVKTLAVDYLKAKSDG